MRLRFSLMAVALVASAVSATAQEPARRFGDVVSRAVSRVYQGNNGPEQTERFSRKIKIGRDGRFSVSNIAGDIVVTGGSGDEVSIDAVKRTRGSQAGLASVTIEVDAGNGRVDVRTAHSARTDRVRVDYTITVPASTEVVARSVSGNVRVTTVQGSVRAQTVSGGVTTSGTPKLELAKSISGDVDISDIATDRGLDVTTISGAVRGRNVKARSLDLKTVSGDVVLTDALCDRIDARSISGSIEYSGSLAKRGTYDLTAHSGNIRLTLAESTGFHVAAVTFSGTIRSDLPLTIGGDSDRARGNGRRGINRRSIQATFGDGSATLNVHSFSGDIVISKR